MAAKQRDKLSKSLFEDDDLLDSLFEDKKPSVRGRAARGGPLTRSSATENIFSMLAEEVKKDGGDTEDLDDMDAELFASIKKPGSAPPQTKPFGTKAPKNGSTALEHNANSDEPVKKPNSAPAASTRNYRKFSFSEDDDPLADLLDDLLPDETKPEAKASVQPASPSASPNFQSRTSKAAKTPAHATVDDEKDDLMDALGFDSDQTNPRKKETSLWPNKERSEPPQRARTRLDEILESLPSPRLLERPPTGERKEQPLSREKTPGVQEQCLEEDLTFGSYQPTLGSVPEGRQSRRPSVRFSTEDVSVSTTDKKPKPTTPTSALHRSSADWLGLTTKDDNTFLEEETKTSTASPDAPSSPLLEGKPSLTGGQATSTARTAAESPATAKHTKPEVSTTRKEEEEDDWLAGVLSRKKTVSASNPETKNSKQEDFSDEGEAFDLESFVSKPVTSRAPRGREDNVASVKETSPAAHTIPVREQKAEQAVPQQNKMPNTSTSVQQQVTISADNLQQILQQQQMMQSQLLSFGGVVDAGVQQRLVDKEHQPGGYSALQLRIIQLEGQVKTLQLERDQSQMTLENVQQQHNQDMELMENTHKARVKLLEESAAQRELRARQDSEDLMERLAAVTRSAEQERSELQDLYQRKQAQAQQERDREVERLRDLQRKSVSEMKKDHEDQVQRLKRLKDEEIDAVTSATSQTRSLTVVIEQMEQFSSRLGELSSRVESTHEHTAHGLEQGERHRDEQRRIMQDRLAQQQKAMADERTYLKEIISRMDTQLNEQQRQLEKERWKVTGEQAKAESTQRGLEEERRSLTMQMHMEREELERAKSALLEEQKSVMQHCAEERRKLAAEWTHFHAHEKQRHDRAEREVGSLLEKREGSILGLAQEQANLKLLTADVRQKEMAVAQERDTLERLREELDREKDKISSTGLRLKSRAQEVEAFSKLAAERYEEGERALQEAQRVEAEHGARLRYIQTQTERLRQQEQRILQERMRLNLEQKKTERREETHITSLQLIPPSLPDSLMPNPELSSTLSTPPPTSNANAEPMMLQASLALWKYTAEKDREYLHEENLFLENLKKNRSFTSDWPMRTGHLQ